MYNLSEHETKWRAIISHVKEINSRLRIHLFFIFLHYWTKLVNQYPSNQSCKLKCTLIGRLEMKKGSLLQYNSKFGCFFFFFFPCFPWSNPTFFSKKMPKSIMGITKTCSTMLGNAKMCLGISKHIFDGKMGRHGKRRSMQYFCHTCNKEGPFAYLRSSHINSFKVFNLNSKNETCFELDNFSPL